MKKPLIGLLVILMVSTASGSLGLASTISKTCPGNYQPVISMAEPGSTYNNPGTPSLYDYKLCVRGINTSSTRLGA